MDGAIEVSQDLKLEFARRKKKHGYASLLMLVLLVVLVALGQASLSPVLAEAALTVLIALALVDFIYIFRTWRCPACNRFLGARSTAYGPLQSLDSCPKCDVKLV